VAVNYAPVLIYIMIKDDEVNSTGVDTENPGVYGIKNGRY